MRIYLIGFMGSGKSHTGRQLSELTGVRYTDLDQEIEQLAGMSIPEIFAKGGEKDFRQKERQALEGTLAHAKLIVATGGGAPCFFDNIEWMNRHGLCIYLKTAPELLFSRLVKEMDYRPLLRGKSEAELQNYIQAKVKEREAFYLKASVIYEQKAENEDVARVLVDQLSNIIGH